MEQDKIMSAEEFFEKQDLSIYERYSDEVNYSSIYMLMRRYAKYHRKLALEAASEKAEITDILGPSCSDHTPFWGPCQTCGSVNSYETVIGHKINKDSILNAYSLENIK